jgi:hypothetical protein
MMKCRYNKVVIKKEIKENNKNTVYQIEIVIINDLIERLWFQMSTSFFFLINNLVYNLLLPTNNK